LLDLLIYLLIRSHNQSASEATDALLHLGAH